MFDLYSYRNESKKNRLLFKSSFQNIAFVFESSGHQTLINLFKFSAFSQHFDFTIKYFNLKLLNGLDNYLS